MAAIREWVARSAGLFRRRRMEREMAEEMRAHLEMQEAANRARGMDAEEARCAALRQFGGLAQVQERCRDQRGWGWLESLGRDLVFAARALRRSPGFTAVVVLTLACGIGATTAVFALVEAVLLRPPGFVQPDRIVAVRAAFPPALPDANLSLPDFLDCASQTRALTALAAYRTEQMNLTGRGEPQSLWCARATAGFFGVFGVPPLLGRTFSAEEDRPGAGPVVVLSHGFWQAQFGGAPEALGQTIMLGGVARTVIGVMPAAFTGVGSGSDAVWLPLAATAEERSDGARGARGYSVVGRLAPGVSVTAATSELAGLAGQLERQYPDFNRGWSLRVVSWLDFAMGNVRPLLWILLGAVACVQAVVCANIANLLLARAAGRTGEMAMRAALGASRGRLAQQFLVEGLLLAALGAVGGGVLAYVGGSALRAVLPGEVGNAELRCDGAVVGFVAGLALLTGVAFGLAPWAASARGDLLGALKSAGRHATGAGRHRLGRWLVAGEVAVALVLLYGAGLLGGTLLKLTAVDPGFNPAGAYRLQLALAAERYGTHGQRMAFVHAVLAQMAALPGVQAVGCTHALPIVSNWSIDFVVAGRPLGEGAKPKTSFYAVTPGYFPAMGLRLVRGRLFNDRDDEKAPPVVLISETFARQHFPNEDPLGRRIYIMKGPPRYGEIVGIVADVRQGGPEQPSSAQAYEPMAQWSIGMVEVVVRVAPGADFTVRDLRSRVFAVDPDQPVAFVEPLGGLVRSATARQRSATVCFLLFALGSLAIAALGLYGVVAYGVARRTREFGVRLALGANPATLVRGVMAQVARWVLAGAAAGLAVALVAARALDSLLFGTSAVDPAVLAGVVLVFLAVAGVACWWPARRAAQVDPVVSLAAE